MSSARRAGALSKMGLLSAMLVCPPAVAAPLTAAQAEALATDAVLAFDADLRRAEAAVRTAGALPDGEVRIGLNNLPTTRDPLRNDPGTWRVLVRQNVDPLGSLSGARAAARAEVIGVEAERAERVRLARDVARHAAHQHALAQQQIALATAEHEASAAWAEAMGTAVAAGQAQITQRFAAERASARALQAVADAQEAAARAAALLRTVTRQADATGAALPLTDDDLPALPPDLSAAEGTAVVQPAERAAQAAMEAAQAQQQVARTAAIPWLRFAQVGVDAGPVWRNETLPVGVAAERSVDATLSFQLPLNAWSSGRVQEATAAADAAASARDQSSAAASVDRDEALAVAAARRHAAAAVAARIAPLAADVAKLTEGPQAMQTLTVREALAQLARARREAAEAVSAAWQAHDDALTVLDDGSASPSP